MMRNISPIMVIAGVLTSAMVLMGMSCGAGGFSIPANPPKAMVETVNVDLNGTGVDNTGAEDAGQTDSPIH